MSVTLPYIIRMGGCYWPEAAHTNLHIHDYYELVYFVSGKGITYIGEQEYDITPGSLILVSPGTSHRESMETASEGYYICFQTEDVLPEGVCKNVDNRIESMICDIQTEQAIKAYKYEDMITAKMMELKILLERSFCQFGGNRKRDFTQDTVRYLEENYYKKIVLQDLAAELNYSYGYFQHIFKEKIGVSPQQFLIRKRVEAAKEMLAVSGMSCTDIAYACGFATSTQMSVIFKKQTGISPTEYRVGKLKYLAGEYEQ